ncbi:hypothetical protein BLNAU_7606 [Blattamonas nauphoetae]|uniref:Uncharacterized protein n=1 Tax=Blattamonas nauphoetae TaxID=2049346 RepID=A0ABQ9Y134_9EUKA|nr:hypothetical protein BLNAU_7606 [Blattamonas nauphoetae]
MSTKAIIFDRISSFSTLMNPDSTEREILDLRSYTFDILQEAECVEEESKQIRSLTILHRNVKIDSSHSFFAYAILYVDGIGRLHIKPFHFPKCGIEEATKKTRDWVEKIELPPPDERFSIVKSQGDVAFALTESGQLWTRGIKPEGGWSDEEKFIISPHFDAKDGMMNSSLGPSKIKSFSFEGQTAIILLENGAVFLYGKLDDMLAYNPSVDAEGILELTDSSKFNPKFEPTLSGDLNNAAGSYGIFGTFKPVKYYRKMRTFVCEEGTIFFRVLVNTERVMQVIFTPVDRYKYFSGLTMVAMGSHVLDAYLTDQGRLVVFKGDRAVSLIPSDLLSPRIHRFTPIPLDQVAAILLPRDSSMLVLAKDGRVFRFDNHTEAQNRPSVDITSHVTRSTVDDLHPAPMSISKYFQTGMQIVLLFK